MFRSLPASFLVVCSVALGLGFSGCQTVEPQSAQPAAAAHEASDVRVDIRSPLAPAPNEEEIRKFQPDVRMVALFHRGVLTVRIHNTTTRSIMVSPANFALITGRGKVHPFSEPDVQAKFPSGVVEPDAFATGQFHLTDYGNLTGRYVVFTHPALKPSRAIVELPPRIPVPQARRK